MDPGANQKFFSNMMTRLHGGGGGIQPVKMVTPARNETPEKNAPNFHEKFNQDFVLKEEEK